MVNSKGFQTEGNFQLGDYGGNLQKMGIFAEDSITKPYLCMLNISI